MLMESTSNHIGASDPLWSFNPDQIIQGLVARVWSWNPNEIVWIVEIQFTYGKKLILTNVFHVPEIKKNLVSANLLCKKGIKVVIESNKLILLKNGMFIGKGYCSDPHN